MVVQIRIKRGKNYPQKIEKKLRISWFAVPDVLF
jgi:hypothetical protein